MSDFTVVTCVSKPNVYSECLLKSVYATKGQYTVDILPIINVNGAYTASTAYNIGLQSARSDIVLFAHQDVRLLPGFFDNLAQVANVIPGWAIIGAAGISTNFNITDVGKWGGSKTDDKIIVGSVWHTDDVLNDPYWNGIRSPTPVHCVDEFLFAMYKPAELTFDHAIGGFHGYGIDISLQARDKGHSVYASGLPSIHYGQYSSSITTDRSYWLTLRRLYKKWNTKFPELLGTFMHWSVDGITSYIPASIIDSRGMEATITGVQLHRARLLRDADRLENWP